MSRRRASRYRWGRRGVTGHGSPRSQDCLTHRERALQRFPGWIVALLGPYSDEVGWHGVVSKWVMLGTVTGIAVRFLELPINPWPTLCYGIAAILFLIAMITS